MINFNKEIVSLEINKYIYIYIFLSLLKLRKKKRREYSNHYVTSEQGKEISFHISEIDWLIQHGERRLQSTSRNCASTHAVIHHN